MNRYRGGWRASVVRRLPVALMEYPFESFLAVYALLACGVTAAGMGLPSGTPAAIGHLLSAMLGLAGVTLALGMRTAYRLALPIGLRLLAFTVGIIGVAGVAMDGPRALPSATLLAYIALLALARSLYLRAATEVRHRARLARRGRDG